MNNLLIRILMVIVIAIAIWFFLKPSAERTRRHTLEEPPVATQSAETSNSPTMTEPPVVSPTPSSATAPSATPAQNSVSAGVMLTPKEIEEHRSAAKSQLSAIYTAQAAYRAEYDRYSSDLGHLGLSPADSTMKVKVGFIGAFEPRGGLNPNENPQRMTSDIFTDLRGEENELLFQYDSASNQIDLRSLHRACNNGCTVTEDRFESVAAFNLDADSTLDVWTIDNEKNIRHVIDDLAQ